MAHNHQRLVKRRIRLLPQHQPKRNLLEIRVVNSVNSPISVGKVPENIVSNELAKTRCLSFVNSPSWEGIVPSISLAAVNVVVAHNHERLGKRRIILLPHHHWVPTNQKLTQIKLCQTCQQSDFRGDCSGQVVGICRCRCGAQ